MKASFKAARKKEQQCFMGLKEGREGSRIRGQAEMR